MLIIYWLESIVVASGWVLWIGFVRGGTSQERAGFALYIATVFALLIALCYVFIAFAFEVRFDLTTSTGLAVAAFALQHGYLFLLRYGSNATRSQDDDVRDMILSVAALGAAFMVMFLVLAVALAFDLIRAAPLILIALKCGADVLVQASRRTPPAVRSDL